MALRDLKTKSKSMMGLASMAVLRVVVSGLANRSLKAANDLFAGYVIGVGLTAATNGTLFSEPRPAVPPLSSPPK